MLRFLTIVGLLTFSAAAPAAENLSSGIPIENTTTRIEEELTKPTEVQYLDTQLGDVATDLKLRHKIEIQIDIEQLKQKNKGPETPLTLTLRDVSLASMLSSLLEPQELTYVIWNQTLLITTLEAEAKYVETKVYKVGDLVQDLEALQKVIEVTVAPQTWKSLGGNVGTIMPHAETKTLVITHTARNHRQVAKLLEALRTAKKQDAEK